MGGVVLGDRRIDAVANSTDGSDRRPSRRARKAQRGIRAAPDLELLSAAHFSYKFRDGGADCIRAVFLDEM